MQVNYESYDIGDRLIYQKPFKRQTNNHAPTCHFRIETDYLFVRAGLCHRLSEFMDNPRLDELRHLRYLQLPLAWWTDRRGYARVMILRVLTGLRDLCRVEMVVGDSVSDMFFLEWDQSVTDLRCRLADSYRDRYHHESDYHLPVVALEVVPAWLAELWGIDDIRQYAHCN
jgi:hypothetical protein